MSAEPSSGPAATLAGAGAAAAADEPDPGAAGTLGAPADLREVIARLHRDIGGLRAVRRATMAGDSRRALDFVIRDLAACQQAVAREAARPERQAERKAAALAELEQGGSLRQVAAAYGLPVGTVNGWQRAAASRSTEERRQSNAAYKTKTHDGERHCPRCDDWLPLAEFDTKNDKGTLRWCCRECYKTYQRERYVAANKRAIIVEVVDGDEIVGATCNGCGQPFEIGDLVAGTVLRHTGCVP